MCGRAFNASRIEHHGNARIVEGCVLVGCKVVAPIFGFRDQFAGDKIIHFLVLWREREEGGYGSVCRIILLLGTGWTSFDRLCVLMPL